MQHGDHTVIDLITCATPFSKSCKYYSHLEMWDINHVRCYTIMYNEQFSYSVEAG